jgi:Protein of unknown function (DUF3224)
VKRDSVTVRGESAFRFHFLWYIQPMFSIRFVLGACLTLAGFAQAQAKPTTPDVQRQPPMTQQASGPFDVKVIPQKPDSDVTQAANLGRMSIDKRFHGDLEATSKGEMIAAQTEVKGSAGYVAMERVTGTLKGRKGSFVLQHSATMNRGIPELSITVVPDSGTEELKGLVGKMNIIISDGKHSYEFDYTLTEQP